MRPGFTVWVSQATTNAEWPGGSVRHYYNHNPKDKEIVMDKNDLDDRARNSEILAWVALVVSVVSLIAIALLKLLR